MPISVSSISYQDIEKYHFKRIGKKWGRHLIRKFGPRQGVDWWEANPKGTCALRVSVALARGGVSFKGMTAVRRRWYHEGRREYYPARAADYPDAPILAGGEVLDGTPKQKKNAVQGRKGIIYFGGNMEGYSGHITLWNGEKLHYPSIDGFYWNQPKVVFWEMAP